MTSTAESRFIGGGYRLLTTPAVAGVVYLVAWLAGLAVWPSNLDVAASGSQVVAAYGGHRGVAMVQSLLVHGVAGVALAVVALALALLVSGIGYLLLSSTLAPAAFVSGPLLLAWVTATGISLAGPWPRR